MFSVNYENNFCRVFQIPTHYPSEFCFGGGINVPFKMIDWFRPVELERYENGISLEELEQTIIPWVKEKSCVMPGHRYIIIFNFGPILSFSS
jgi:hypothetical protein